MVITYNGLPEKNGKKPSYSTYHGEVKVMMYNGPALRAQNSRGYIPVVTEKIFNKVYTCVIYKAK